MLGPLHNCYHHKPYRTRARVSRYCIDVDSGLEVWRADLGGKVFASPHGLRLTAQVRAVVAVTVPGRMVLLSAACGSTLAETQLGGEVFSSPVCHKGAIYVGCRDDHVHSFRVVATDATHRVPHAK